MPLYSCANPFSSDQSLRVIGVKQKGGKLFTTKTGRHITGPQRTLMDNAHLLERLAATRCP